MEDKFPIVTFPIYLNELFEKCFSNEIQHFRSNDDKLVQLQLKWVLCFRMLFYLDQCHDFLDIITDPIIKNIQFLNLILFLV